MRHRRQPKPSSEYEQQYSGDVVTFEGQGLHVACCHCGLVHWVKPVAGRDVRLQWVLDEGETRVRRRWLAAKGKLIRHLFHLKEFLV